MSNELIRNDLALCCYQASWGELLNLQANICWSCGKGHHMTDRLLHHRHVSFLQVRRDATPHKACVKPPEPSVATSFGHVATWCCHVYFLSFHGTMLGHLVRKHIRNRCVFGSTSVLVSAWSQRSLNLATSSSNAFTEVGHTKGEVVSTARNWGQGCLLLMHRHHRQEDDWAHVRSVCSLSLLFVPFHASVLEVTILQRLLFLSHSRLAFRAPLDPYHLWKCMSSDSQAHLQMCTKCTHMAMACWKLQSCKGMASVSTVE